MQTRLQARLLAEERAIFHFLDLPPELRNAVYVELLTIREKDTPQNGLAQKYCYPRVLGTCRQIHREAAGYLPADDLELDMSFVVCDAGAGDDIGVLTTCDHHSKPNSFVCYINHRRFVLDKDVPLLTAPTATWPSILSKISKLHLEVDFCAPPTIDLDDPVLAQEHTPNILQLNHAIPDLQAFLLGHGKLKEMSVSVRYHSEATGHTLTESVLGPLGASRLCTELTLHFDSGRSRTMPFPRSPRCRRSTDLVAYTSALQNALARQIRAEKKKVPVDEKEVEKIKGLKRAVREATEFPGFVTRVSIVPLQKAIKEIRAYLKNLPKDSPGAISYTKIGRKRHLREGNGRLLLVD